MIITEKKLDEIDKKILSLTGDGMTAKEAGQELNISQRSVEAKIREMKRWYGCKSTSQLLVRVKNDL